MRANEDPLKPLRFANLRAFLGHLRRENDLAVIDAPIDAHHVVRRAPILIDARMKPCYPPEVMADPETSALVRQRWREYFPQGIDMGGQDS